MGRSCVFLAGGGTLGHCHVSVAVAEAWLEAEPQVRLFMVGRAASQEEQVATLYDLPFLSVRAKPFEREGFLGKLLALLVLPLSLLDAARHLRSLRPDLVVGMGGFVSLGTCWAARLLGVPMVVHEANVVFGLSNRMLAGGASRVFVSWKDRALSKGVEGVQVGTPVRREVLEAARARSRPRPSDDKSEAALRVVLLGGSEGCSSMAQWGPRTMGLVRQRLGVGRELRVTHVVGAGSVAQVEAHYRRVEVEATCVARVEMAGTVLTADLVLSALGAVAFAELTLLHTPCVFVPTLDLAQEHQLRMAKYLQAHHPELSVVLSPADDEEQLVDLIVRLLEDANAAERNVEGLLQNARRLAGAEMVEECRELLATL